MKGITREQRMAYIQMLSGLTYKTKVIPIRNGVIGTSGALIDLGGGISFQAYIIINGQSRGVNTVKNGMVHNTALTIDINTVFSGASYNMAGSEWAEEITDLVYSRLYDDETFRLKEFGVNNDRFVIASNSNFIQPMPVQYTDTSRVFRSVLIFENVIHHTVEESTVTDFWIKTL